MSTPQKKYVRRKHRANILAKRFAPEYRAVINRSNKYVVVQVVDKAGKTVAMMTDKKMEGATKTDRARTLGQSFAKSLAENGITSLVFDRNGYLYHGRVKACCE